MAKDNKKWYTVGQAALAALMDKGEDDSRFEQFLHWALEGARDFHIDQAREIKTVVKPMTAHKSITKPDDYVDWLKIGIKCGSTIKTFTHDTTINFNHDCEDGVKKENNECYDDLWSLDTVETQYLFHNFYSGGHSDGVDEPIYGLAYKHNGLGYFRDHIEAGEFQFRAVVPKNSEIILEYISDGWDPSKKTVINPLAFKLIKLYVHWQEREYNSRASYWEVERAEDNYWDEFNRVNWRTFPMTVEDFQEVMREAYVATPQN